jgi:hypothetical protein
MRAFSRVLFLLGLMTGACAATTLPPELKAYDFGEAYYLEDGGVVIAPYAHGFYCPAGIVTPEGIRVMPGGTFSQFDEGQRVEEDYRLVRLNPEQTRAFFRERIYRYQMVRDAQGRIGRQRGMLLATDDFYLTQFRALEWFDHVFTGVDLHPGLQSWRTRPRYN